MAQLELLVRDNGLKHSPRGFSDVARRLADDGHSWIEQAERLEVVHHKKSQFIWDLQPQFLNRRNDAFAGDVARSKEGVRPIGPTQDFEGRQTDFVRVEAEIVEAASFQGVRLTRRRNETLPPLIENPEALSVI